MRKHFTLLVVLILCLALVGQGTAFAKWTDNSGNLPGIDHNVLLKAGVAGGVGVGVIWFLIAHHHHQHKKAEASPLAVPSVLSFDKGDRERPLSIDNRGQEAMSVADVAVDGGFTISPAFSFPVLIHAGDHLVVPISRAAPYSAKRGRVTVTLISPEGKTVTRLVALRAMSFHPAQ